MKREKIQSDLINFRLEPATFEPVTIISDDGIVKTCNTGNHYQRELWGKVKAEREGVIYPTNINSRFYHVRHASLGPSFILDFAYCLTLLLALKAIMNSFLLFS